MEPIINTHYPLLSSKPSFESYFAEDEILKQLCRYRLKEAQKKHKAHLFRELSDSPAAKKNIERTHEKTSILKDILPPRKSWARPRDRQRFNTSQELYVWSILKRIEITRIYSEKGEITPPKWYDNLSNFLGHVHDRINKPESFNIKTPLVYPMKKENKKDCTEYRPISNFTLEDKIIISQTTKYLTDQIDECFHDNSLAFRSKKKNTGAHHRSIERILSYLSSRSNRTIWVSECDINKFYDCVNHQVVMECMNRLIKDSTLELDARALEIFNQYLACYSFSNIVWPLNSDIEYVREKLKGGRFGWPIEKLINQQYGLFFELENIGIPQGGAMSCLIANIVLHYADTHVLSGLKDDDLLYLRFCDDIILMHTNKRKCELALRRYESAISQKRLLSHPPEEVTEYNKMDFWNRKNFKSKRPFKWGPKQKSSVSVPWIAFVGYQIRYDGLVRVRKTSLKKEMNKQKQVLLDYEKNISILFPPKNDKVATVIHRKAKESLQSSFNNRLISMSAGRVKIYNDTQTPSFCWINGFKGLTTNFVSKSQLKTLDRHKEILIERFKRKTKNLSPQSAKKRRRKKNTTAYYGHPFSYSKLSRLNNRS